jgi:hypothetical protein
MSETTASTPITNETGPSQRIPDTASLTQKEQLDFSWNVHKYLNDYIRFADTKAALVVLVCTSMLGAMFVKGMHTQITAVPLKEQGFVGLLIIFGYLGLLAGIVLAIFVINPRLPGNANRGLIFWEDIKAITRDEYLKVIRSSTSRDFADHIAGHVFTLSSVCSEKYAWLVYSIYISGFGAMCSLLAHALK